MSKHKSKSKEEALKRVLEHAMRAAEAGDPEARNWVATVIAAAHELEGGK